MMNTCLWKSFCHWKKLASSAASFKHYRNAAERRMEELEGQLHPLQGEVGALRLFKDAMASSERTMLMRKGGGYVALEEYVATVENRISAAALEGALEGDSDHLVEHYGLTGALEALRGAAQAEHGQVLSPRGGHTSWRHVPQMGAGAPPSPVRRSGNGYLPRSPGRRGGNAGRTHHITPATATELTTV